MKVKIYGLTQQGKLRVKRNLFFEQKQRWYKGWTERVYKSLFISPKTRQQLIEELRGESSYRVVSESISTVITNGIERGDIEVIGKIERTSSKVSKV